LFHRKSRRTKPAIEAFSAALQCHPDVGFVSVAVQRPRIALANFNLGLLHAGAAAKSKGGDVREAENDFWFETEFSPQLGAVYYQLALLHAAAAETLAKERTADDEKFGSTTAGTVDPVAERLIKARRLMARAVMCNPAVPAFWTALADVAKK